MTIIAAIVTTSLFGVRSLAGLALTLVLALGGLVPSALIGHSASSSDHEGAINSLGLHLVGVSTWVGGIIMLAVLSGLLRGSKATGNKDITEPDPPQVLPLWQASPSCWSLPRASSTRASGSRAFRPWSAPLGADHPREGAATIVLGGIGVMHRQWVIPAQLERKSMTTRRVLWQLVSGGAAGDGRDVGTRRRAGRSAPPQPATYAPDASPAFILSGYDLPPELTPGALADRMAVRLALGRRGPVSGA